MRKTKLIIYILCISLSGILLLNTSSFCSNEDKATAEKKDENKPWTGTLEDGTVITEEDLAKILADHKKWLETDGKEGERADLRRAYLGVANLNKANLSEAWLGKVNLNRADLNEANLSEAWLLEANLEFANLRQANLSKADLEFANLSAAYPIGANLSEANLRKAVLIWADLTEADLSNTFLAEAYLSEANLSGAKLSRSEMCNFSASTVPNEVLVGAADLSRANLSKADLTETNLVWVNLSGADLRESKIDNDTRFEAKWMVVWQIVNKGAEGRILNYFDLSDANLTGANLSGAHLTGTNLTRSILIKADLSGAILNGADLTEADLRDTNFKDADITYANFHKSTFDPLEIGDKLEFLGAYGFSSIQFTKSQPIIKLRKMAKESGSRQQEKELTAALRKKRRNKQFSEKIFFDLPTDYGANPWRCLLILAGFFFLFSYAYVWALELEKKTGIWKLWPKERLRNKEDETVEGKTVEAKKNKPELLTGLRGPRVLGYAFYFSLLTTFHIGWRDLNVGNWITRMQPNEYILKPNGWVRFVSGLHSLISIYLLALWALSYFARPFE
jgi:uncharacterized protein YjbI with pentapeptide repeats